MAVKKSSFSTIQMLMRLLALTGLMVAAVGLITWLSLAETDVGIEIVLVGGILFVIGLALELPGVIAAMTSRRGVVGGSMVVQVALALALLIGCNVFSFKYHKRYDCTREKIFTIDEQIRTQLAKLRTETDIVVYQNHTSFGVEPAKQDNYDAAADRQIVEKVKDLVEQFQELGPRFKVQVLDRRDQDFEVKLKAMHKNEKTKALAEAISAAPENSVFFHAGKKVQRLAFHDIYQLDREASKESSNLVLKYQGIEPFARKILNVEEKTPRIGVAVIHPVLGLSDDKVDFYTMSGAKKALESQGFQTIDVILKKGRRLENFDAYTYDESRFESLDNLRQALEGQTKLLRKVIDTYTTIRDNMKAWSLPQINEEYIYVRLQGRQFLNLVKMKEFLDLKKAGRVIEISDIDERDRQREIEQKDIDLSMFNANLNDMTQRLDGTRNELKKLKVDDLEEKHRIADVREKMTRVLADCDLLILPRTTLIDIPEEIVVPNSLHQLHEAQLAALREFQKSGKPVLFCLGPPIEPPEDGVKVQDDVEKMLEELGFKLPRQTVLFTSEVDAYAQPKGGLQENTKVDIPSASFLWKDGLSLPGRSKGSAFAKEDADLGKNDAGVEGLRNSLRFFQRNLGTKKNTDDKLESSKELELKLRYPRPVYYTKPYADPQRVAGLLGIFAAPESLWRLPLLWEESTMPRFVEKNTFIATDRSGWNDDQPFPTEQRLPHFEPSKPSDPNFGTLLQKRQGSFPIASAAEVELPSSWFPERTEEGKSVSVIALAAAPDGFGPMLAAFASLVPRKQDKVSERVVVIGSGSVFTGKNLNFAQQKLLFDTCNWLLGRDDLLARESETWQFPRVKFSTMDDLLWQWFTRVGIPLICVFFGICILIIRHTR